MASLENSIPASGVEPCSVVGRLGCSHYKRGCELLAPCCTASLRFFPCRFCHDETIESEQKDPRKRHTLDRHSVTQIRCLRCSKVQKPQQICEGCGLCMGKYFCGTCNLFDDEDKGQWHCGLQPDGSQGCGICRVGGQGNFFHCSNCGTCLAVATRDRHECRPNLLQGNCPICCEHLQTSRISSTFLPCGHSIHVTCLDEYTRAGHSRCPFCSKSLRNMARVWSAMDLECAMTPMPAQYCNTWLRVLCSDCNLESDVRFHVVGLKCGNPACGGYNTRKIGLAKDDHPLEPEAPALPMLAVAGPGGVAAAVGGAGEDAAMATVMNLIVEVVGEGVAATAGQLLQARPELRALAQTNPVQLASLLIRDALERDLDDDDEDAADDDEGAEGGDERAEGGDDMGGEVDSAPAPLAPAPQAQGDVPHHAGGTPPGENESSERTS